MFVSTFFYSFEGKAKFSIHIATYNENCTVRTDNIAL